MIKLRPWKGSKNEFEVDVIVTGPDGRTRRKRVKAPVTGRSHAERWARALEQELFAQLLSPESRIAPPCPTFGEFARTFLDYCRANRRGVNTLLNYEMHIRCYLLPVLGKVRLDQVRPADVTAIKASLADRSHNTACEALKTLRRIIHVAIAEKAIEKAPVTVDIPKRIKKAVVAYDEHEQKALLEAATALGPKYLAVVLLGIDAGLRAGEIAGLHWSDIDLHRETMVIRHNIVRGRLDRTKGRTEEEIALTGRLARALRNLPVKGTFVFVSAHPRGHFDADYAQTCLSRVVKQAQIPWHGTHVLRKTCGTRIADGGGGVAAVAAHLRHKDLQTASRYIDRRGASARAIAALEK